MRNQNTPVTGFTDTAASQDAAMARLTPRVRHYVLYDATASVDARQLAEVLASGVGEDQLLRMMRGATRDNTAQVYGRAHPQAAFSTAR